MITLNFFRSVLSRYMEFEARFGDLSGILKIDKRLSLSPQVSIFWRLEYMKNL